MDKQQGRYAAMNVSALRAECKARGLKGYSSLRRDALVRLLETSEPEPKEVQPQPMVKPEPILDLGPTVDERLGELALRFEEKERKARNRAKRRRQAIRSRGGVAGF